MKINSCEKFANQRRQTELGMKIKTHKENAGNIEKSNDPITMSKHPRLKNTTITVTSLLKT